MQPKLFFYSFLLLVFMHTSLAAIGDACHSSQGNGTCKAKSNCTAGFTVVGACPNDPVDVQCCIKASCKEDRLTGTCLDKSRLPCEGGQFKAGLCPGSKDVQCCFKNPTDKFVAYIQRVYDLAKQYGGDRNPNQLVMEWLRHEKYNDYRWKLLIGGVDQGFIDHVKKAGVVMIKEFPDPFYNINIDVAHFGACMNAVYLKGKPKGISTNRGDVGGWGGDWMTFYGEWRRDIDQFPSGYKYCKARLAKSGDQGTFKLNDLVEDADCYNIAWNLRHMPNFTIVSEIAENLRPGGAYTSRMRRYYSNRFGDDRGTAASLAKNMLLPGDDVIVNTGRIRLIQQKGGFLVTLPLWLSDEELDDLCRGFADVLYDLVVQENARQ